MTCNGHGALRKLVLLAHFTVLHGWVSQPLSATLPRRAGGRCSLSEGGRGRVGVLNMVGAAGRSAKAPPPPPQKRRMDVEKADFLPSEDELEREEWEDRKGRGKTNTAFHKDYDEEADALDLVPRDGLFYHDNKGNLRKMKFAFDMERGDGEREAEEIYYDFMEQDADSMKAWKGGEDWDEWRKRASDWMFFDQARVYVKGGDGGDGEVAYRREAHVALGGPFGGSGGPGGDVIFVTDEGDNTLASVRASLHMIADSGRRGQGKAKASAAAGKLSQKSPLTESQYRQLVRIMSVIEIKLNLGSDNCLITRDFRFSTPRPPW